VSAKKQAADAESHLAEALKRATEAAAALERIKSPRRLTNVPELIATLTAFKGTEYTFSAVFADEESLLLLKIIDDVLQRSGWKRGKPVGGFPAINVFGPENPYGVPAALTDGIRISADSPEETLELQALGLEKLRSPVKESVFLNLSLSSVLLPPEQPAPLVNVVKGSSKTVRISIGKKPQ
jgi:hypothetical protein